MAFGRLLMSGLALGGVAGRLPSALLLLLTALAGFGLGPFTAPAAIGFLTLLMLLVQRTARGGWWRRSRFGGGRATTFALLGSFSTPPGQFLQLTAPALGEILDRL